MAVAIGILFVCFWVVAGIAFHVLLLRITVVGELRKLYPNGSGLRPKLSLIKLQTDLSRYWAWMAVASDGFYFGDPFSSVAFVPLAKIESCVRDDGLLFFRCRVAIEGLTTFVWISGKQAGEMLYVYETAQRLKADV